jgi:hypothetical protein
VPVALLFRERADSLRGREYGRVKQIYGKHHKNLQIGIRKVQTGARRVSRAGKSIGNFNIGDFDLPDIGGFDVMDTGMPGKKKKKRSSMGIDTGGLV